MRKKERKKERKRERKEIKEGKYREGEGRVKNRGFNVLAALIY